MRAVSLKRLPERWRIRALILLGTHVDHINGDRLDNRRFNLRLCTNQQNQMNKTKRVGSSSRFKGVYFQKTSRKWVAAIQKDRKLKHIGLFSDELDAARAYDAAAKEAFGEFAWLNFPTAEDQSSELRAASPPPFCEYRAPL